MFLLQLSFATVPVRSTESLVAVCVTEEQKQEKSQVFKAPAAERTALPSLQCPESVDFRNVNDGIILNTQVGAQAGPNNDDVLREREISQISTRRVYFIINKWHLKHTHY